MEFVEKLWIFDCEENGGKMDFRRAVVVTSDNLGDCGDGETTSPYMDVKNKVIENLKSKGWKNIQITWYQSLDNHFPLFLLFPFNLIVFYTSMASVSDKPTSTINIKNAVPLVLDLDQMNYDIWRELFEIHCLGFGVDDHLQPPPSSFMDHADKDKDKATAESAAAKASWIRTDSIVKSWMYGTLSTSLLHMIFKKQATAFDVWSTLEKVFRDNKASKVIQLDRELRNITIGNSSVTDYCNRIKSLADRLEHMDSKVPDTNLVAYMLNGLSPKFRYIAINIRHREPMPSFWDARSMLVCEEQQMIQDDQREGIHIHSDHSSSPSALAVDSNNNNHHHRGGFRGGRGGRNGRGGRGGGRTGGRQQQHQNNGGGSYTGGQRQQQQRPGGGTPWVFGWFQPNQQQQQAGLLPNPPGQPIQQVPSGQRQPPVQAQQPHQFFSPRQPPNGFPPQQAYFTPQSAPPQNTELTSLPEMFNTMSLNDPGQSEWFMDTGATSHLHSDAGILKSVSDNNSNFASSVLVGDGSSMPVTKMGHTTLPHTNPYRTLQLRNVLITPAVIKNLISVRRFVRENMCTIEFDSFGFSVKDFLTRQVLMRCDSSGDLYPVTTPTPQAFVIGPTLWHQRLGHPGHHVFKHLVSSRFISCSSDKDNTLCHACQTGKHVKLPFSSSNSRTTFPFELVHSDVWTSPVTSNSGIKYYVIFLDDFSHFVWVYPLRAKSDVFDKFVHFRSFVKNQFETDIKSFQCDNGGEYNNLKFHQLFDQNGILMRFSCPHTSQQNGKSERMLRTINNVIRTILFHARLPPDYWVEALHMAAHLLNILPTTTLENDIPYHKLYNKQPTYSHLRVFGCLCFPNIDAPHKLSPRSAPCVFLGYPTNHKGYRCLNLDTNKIVISRHVVFDETVFPFGSMTPNSPPSYSFLDHVDLPHPHTSPTHPPPTTEVVPPHEDTSAPAASSASASPSHSAGSASQTTHSSVSSPPASPLSAHQAPPDQQDPSSPSTPVFSSPSVSPPSAAAPSSPDVAPFPTQHPMVTRAKLGITKPIRKLNLHVDSSSPVPKTYLQAFKDPNWLNAMTDEFTALISNKTWVLVPRPPAANIINCIWLFKKKLHADGSLARYKARLVANGRSQRPGIDCDETFSPVVKPATIRTVLCLAVTHQWPIRQLDVKNAFLHGHLQETVYMHQPPGFRDSTKPDHVCLLQRSLYGLKQAPRAWFHRFAMFLTRIGFAHSKCDSSLFIYRQGSNMVYLLLYVDDIVLTGSSSQLLTHIISLLSTEFSMKHRVL
ncbi:hypothetical protein LXL04_001570 [Taraxacum kok-saghyz]